MGAKLISPTECRILSELAVFGCGGVVSCTQLAKHAQLSRPSLYVLIRRLARGKFVRSRHARLPGCNAHQVLYEITPKGLKARERFAAAVGLHATTAMPEVRRTRG